MHPEARRWPCSSTRLTEQRPEPGERAGTLQAQQKIPRHLLHRPRVACPEAFFSPACTIMLLPTSVYYPLKAFLASRPAEEQQLTLSFSDIERILGRSLPLSAYVGTGWWTNTTNLLTMSTHTKAWQEAGWRAGVNAALRTVTFTRQQA